MTNTIVNASNIYVIIPAYNPGAIVEQVVVETLKYVRHIIIVDDGCDATNKALLQKLAQLSGVTLLVHNENLGKGFAIHTGIEYALKNQAQTIIMLDSDGQHRPQELTDFISFSKSNTFQLVVGVRAEIDKMPLRSKIGNISMAWIFKLLYRQKLQDTQSGYRMMSAKFAQLFLDKVAAGRYETEMKMLMVAARNKIKIDQIPITTQYFDNNSNSKFRPVIDSLRVLGAFFKYSGIGFLSFLVDYAIFISLTYVFGLFFVTAHIISRTCSGIFNFIANRQFVFQSSQPVGLSLVKYLIAVILSLGISATLLYLLVGMFSISAAVAKLFAEASTFLLNYLVLKHFVFRTK